MPEILLEACCGSAEEAVAAAKAGADRLEVCAGLGVGGVTPSRALVEVAVATGVPVVVMVRSSAGWLCPGEDERRVMLQEARDLQGLGVDSVITGALTNEGDLDVDFLRTIQDACERPVACHRLIRLCA